MPDPRIFAKFARDIAGWYGDVGRTAEKQVLEEAQRYGREAGRFGSPDVDGKGFLSGPLLGKAASVDYSVTRGRDDVGYPPSKSLRPHDSGWNQFREDVNEGVIPGFDMHSHPPLDTSTGWAGPFGSQADIKNAMRRGVAGPLTPSEGDFSVWLRHYNDSIGDFTPRPTLRQTAYIQGSQPRSLLALGSPDFNEDLLPGIDKVAPADLYKIMMEQNAKRGSLYGELRGSSAATDVTKDYGATLPELWAAIHTNRMAQRGVPMTFEDRAPFGNGWLQDAMSDFYKSSDRHGEGYEQGGPVEMETGGGVLRKLIRAYHGSPYAFDKFDPTKIGSGEGAQAYGYGHYFTDKEDIARGYRDRLVGRALPDSSNDDPAFRAYVATQLNGGFDQALEALRSNSYAERNGPVIEALLSGAYRKHEPSRGHMYDVNLGVNPQDLLNWDAPLTDVSSKIRDPLLSVLDKASSIHPNAEGMFRSLYNNKSDLGRYTGRDVYSSLSGPWTPRAKGKEEASSLLFGEGIPGIRYLDGMSRNAGEGTSNYVMFPGTEGRIKINNRYEHGGPVDTPTEGEGGMYGAPDSMFNTPESLAAALYPQHGTAYGGGGKVRRALEKAGQLARDALLGDLPEYKPGEETYLRFGKWPKSERSRNYIEGGREEGVSVYPLAPHGGPPLDWSDSGELDSHRYQRLKGSVFPYSPANPKQDHNHPSFFVQGREVGIGQDGEPLLREVKPLSRDWHSPQVGDNEAAPLSYFRRYDDEPLPGIVKPFDGAFADGGPVHMEYGGILRRASRLGDMMNEITNRHGASQGRRFEQASDSANLEHFSDKGLLNAFGNNSPLLTTMPPGRFEDFATPIPERIINERPYYKWGYHDDADMLSPGQQTYDEYLRELRNVSEYGGGLSEVPYLRLRRGLPFNEVGEHEGRHRQRMLAEMGEPNSLVQLLPGDTSRGLQEGRVERLMKSYFLHGNETPYMPEKSNVYDAFRPMVQFPNPVFAEGGEVHMALGGTPPNTGGQYDAPEPEGGGYIRNNLGNMYAGPVKELVTKGASVVRGRPQKPPRLPSEPAWDPARASALQYEIAGEGRGAGPLDLSAADQRIPNIVQEAIPRHDPARGVSPRMQDAINNPTVLYGIEDSIKNGMRIGADRWYHNNPIYQAFTRELGGEQGHAEFMKLMDYNSGSSPRSKVPDNIRNASYYFVNEGRDPRDWAAMPPNPAPYGHLAQDLHRANADLVRIGEGDWGGYDVIKNPKPPSYGTNLGGNFEPVALDSHAFKNIAMRSWDPRFLATSLSDFLTVNPFSKDSLAGVSDDLAGRASFAQRYGTPNGRKDGKFRIDYAPQSLVNSGRLSMEDALARPALWDAKPRNNEYAAGERLYQNMSRDMGLAPAEGQSAAWAGAGELTGLGTPADRTFSEMFNERVLLTAKLRGEDPRDTLRKLIRREAPLMAEGGTVEDQYHPIWQQSFAGGGQPDRPRLDGFGAMARSRPDEYDPVSASQYPWLMDKEDFQPDYGFRNIRDPLDLTHNMDNSLLFQSREPFEGRGFTLTPEEKRAKRLEQRGLEAKPESDINPYDIIRAYAHSLGQRHKEWKPSYSGESLPWQLLQSAGDLGRVASKSVTGNFGDTLSASMRPWDGSYEDRLMQENDLTRQSERDIHPLLKDITSIPALISQRLWAAPAIGDAASNLATPANSVGEWADNQIRPLMGALRNMPDALNRARDMLSGVQPEGRMEPEYYDHGGSVEDQYHPIWSQNFKGGGGVHDILGTLGGLAGNLIPIPVLGPMIGRFAGHTLGNLIEGNSDEIGDDAARDFSFGMADPDTQGWEHGGPVDDFTFSAEEPGMPSFGPGIPGFDVDMLPTNPQIARDRADRQRMMAQAEQASQRGLAQQMKPKDSGGGGGMGDIMGMAMKMAPQIMSMMASHGGPVGHYADGGSIPAPNGAQPWMYGGGALMARGGYLRSHGGMNG